MAGHILNLIFVFGTPLIGTAAALGLLVTGHVTPVHLALFFGMFVLTGLGITVGYHRMATHHSFEAHWAIRAILLIFGSMALEGPVVH